MVAVVVDTRGDQRDEDDENNPGDDRSPQQQQPNSDQLAGYLVLLAARWWLVEWHGGAGFPMTSPSIDMATTDHTQFSVPSRLFSIFPSEGTERNNDD